MATEIAGDVSARDGGVGPSGGRSAGVVGHEEQPTMKPTNPKDIVGSDKLPLHLWPSTATAMGCLGLLDGALKYGRTNWRHAGIRTTIYVDAAMRHLLAYFEGEDHDPDSGVPHLAHALACLAILVDAEASGNVNDDRAMDTGAWRKVVAELTPHVARLKAKHQERTPRHFTIADTPRTSSLSQLHRLRLLGNHAGRQQGEVVYAALSPDRRAWFMRDGAVLARHMVEDLGALP